MPNEVDAEVVQSMLQYYITKCSKLEYDLVFYKSSSEKRLSELSERVKQLQKKQKEKE
jgi:hypothetical protein